jgi:ABC-type Fe3+-siderophore transport system permease subunit
MMEVMSILRPVAALLAGAAIGFVFGTIQNLALARNEKRQASGSLQNGWSGMSGSARRVAYLLVALVLVQIVCPLLFQDGSQWWVSGGVCGGYACALVRRLLERKGV